MKKIWIFIAFLLSMANGNLWANTHIEKRVQDIKRTVNDIEKYLQHDGMISFRTPFGVNRQELFFDGNNHLIKSYTYAFAHGFHNETELYFTNQEKVYYIKTTETNEHHNKKSIYHYYFDEHQDLIRYIDDKKRSYNLDHIPQDVQDYLYGEFGYIKSASYDLNIFKKMHAAMYDL